MKLSRSAVYAAILAVGQGVALSSSPLDAAAALEPAWSGAIPYVSGGVGEDERQEIARLAPEYPLELLFATKGSPNEYLADIKVRIWDRGGRMVLDAIAHGPFLLARVPPGTYSVTADNDGAVIERTIRIAGTGSRRIVFLW